MSDGDDPSTGSHFARDLEKIHYRVMREGRNVVGPTGWSRSVWGGDAAALSLAKHFFFTAKNDKACGTRNVANLMCKNSQLFENKIIINARLYNY